MFSRFHNIGFGIAALGALALSVLPQNARAQVYYDTDGDTINTNINTFAYAGNTNTSPFTINLVAGGQADSIALFNNASLNMTGGETGSISGDGFATGMGNKNNITISDGVVSGAVYGGSYGSHLTITGGTVQDVYASQYVGGIFTMRGGSVGHYLEFNNVGDVGNIYGGTPGPYIIVLDGATLNLYGTNLLATLLRADNISSDYQLSGELQDGTPLVVSDLAVYNGGVVNLISTDTPAVPEPGSVALLIGMATTGAGFLVRRKCRV